MAKRKFWLSSLFNKYRNKRIDNLINQIIKPDIVCKDEVISIIRETLIDGRFTNKYLDCIFMFYTKTKKGNASEQCIIASSLKNQPEEMTNESTYLCLCMFQGQFDFRTCPRVLKAKGEYKDN